MAFMDGCEHYDLDATIDLKWTVNNGCNSTADGRNGRGILIGGGQIAKTLAYSSHWVVGWAIRFNTAVGFAGGAVYQLLHAGEVGIASVIIEGDGSISLKCNGSSVLIQNTARPGQSGFILHPSTWYYFEVETIIGGGANMAITMNMRVNGTLVVSGTASSNINQNNLLLQIAEANFHSFQGGGVVDGITVVDDFGICNVDGTGSINGFFGDIKIGVLFPISDVQIDWSPSRAGTHWNLVNELFPDGDATYISSFTPGQQDNFNWQPVATFVGTVPAVHYGVYARKDDEGTRSFQLTVNGNNVGPVFFPGDTYVYYFVCMDSLPGTSTPWTKAVFDVTTFGVNLIS